MICASNRAGARPDDNHFDFREFLSLQLNGIEQRCCGDNRGAMLIVMHHGDVCCFCNPPFNLETLGGFDVLKVNPSKGLRNVDNRIDEGFWIFCIHFNVKHIDIGKCLQQQALSFHDWFAC